jgi:hypothetical protein
MGVQVPGRQGTDLPGLNLTAQQREAARLGYIKGKTNQQVADEVGCCLRSIERWRALPAFRQYARFLVNSFVETEGQKARVILARGTCAAATKLVENATGGKPASPYEIDAERTVLDRTLGKPSDKQAVAVEVRDEDKSIRVFVGRVPGFPRPAWAGPEEEYEGQIEEPQETEEQEE